MKREGKNCRKGFRKFRKKGIDKREKVCYTHCIKEIEAHYTKSIARKKAAKAVRKRRGCRSGYRGRYLWLAARRKSVLLSWGNSRRAIRGIK